MPNGTGQFRVPLFISLVLAISCLQLLGQEEVEFPQKIDHEGFRSVLVKTGRFYISGQPERDAFLWLKEQGVETLVCLRTQAEMDNRDAVPFDEKALLDSLGIIYVHIPQGGEDNPYSPDALVNFAYAADSSDGKILLHCTVGWRASHLWGAYLVRYRGLSMADALEHARAINFGSIPILDFLGKDLTD